MTEELTVNIPLLRKAVEWAEVEATKPLIDRQWHQGDYVSPPWKLAAIMVMDERISRRGRNVNYEAAQVAQRCGTAYCIAGWVGAQVDERFIYEAAIMVDGVELHVAEVAKNAIGLSDFQGAMLFDGDNTIEAIREIAEEIAGEAL